MKKHTLNISVVSIMCVLCAVSVGDAFAAGSVRALGGTGTYNGTTAAATRSGTTTARVGSLRISPSTTRSVSTATRTNEDGTTTPTERLSIGKYLGGATSVSTGGGSSGGGSGEGGATPAEINQINQNIQQLFNTTQVIEQDITNLENEKQDALTAGDYIKIENDEVSLDLTELEEYLADALNLDSAIDIQYDSTNDILKWTKDGTTWTNLLDLSALSGDYVSADELDQAIEDLASKSALETLTGRVTSAEGAIEELQAAVNNIPDAQVQANWNETDSTSKAYIANKPDLTQYATTAAVQEAIDAIDVPEQVQSNWNETDSTALSYIANKPDLSTYATTTAMNEALEGKQDTISDLTTIRENAAAGAGAATALGDGFDADHTVADAISALPTDANLQAANEKISALETKVGDENSGLVADVAELQDDMDSLAEVAFTGSYNNLSDKPDLSTYATTAAVQEAIEGIDIPEQVQANWNETNTEAASYIANKPDLSTYATTAAVQEAIEGIDIPEQVQANWNETNTEAASYIANKPDLSTYATTAAVQEAIEGIDIPEQVQANWNETNTEAASYIANKPDLSTYATTASVQEAIEGIDIPEQVQANWTEANTTAASYIANKPDLSVYVENPELPSTSGDYLLKMSNSNGSYSYEWTDASAFGGDPTGSEFEWDDSGW
ncbi:MAG: hypothetical protein J6Y49_00180 [Alphaproteobacteria bacterium]|nr:hypothetical protein [Alphaproteobacteria bacterium]